MKSRNIKLENKARELSNMTKEELLEYCLTANNAITELVIKVENQEKEIAELKELAKMRNAEKYIPSSEQMELLFPEIEATAALIEDFSNKENTEIVKVEGYEKKKPRKKTCSVPSGTPVEEVFHTDDAVSSFIQNDILYVRDEDKIVSKICIIPEKIVVQNHHYAQYKPANTVGTKIVHYENAKLDGTAATPELIATIAVRKFDDHLPLYRQEEIFQRNGFYLSRQKMAKWLIHWYEMLLPLAELIKKEVYSSAYLNKDETPVSVLDLKASTGRVSKNNFMYITIGSTYNEIERTTHKLKMFELIMGRTNNVILDDYQKTGFDGYVMTDGLKPYLHMNPEKHAVCWVHAVRQLKDILKKSKNIEPTAFQICTLAAKLYDIDEKLRVKLLDGTIGVQEFLSQRDELSSAVIDEIYDIIDKRSVGYMPNGPMMKAIKYLQDYKPYMKNYLKVVEGTPSNNDCERSAKSFATSRKNWLFAQTIDGADASAFYFTLIETAKCQGLSPQDYLEYVTKQGLSCKTDEDWKSLLPWNIDLTKVTKARECTMQAKPDPLRAKPYLFTGVNG